MRLSQRAGRGFIADMLQDQLPVRRDFSQVDFGWAGCMKGEAEDERKMWLMSKDFEFSICVDGLRSEMLFSAV